VGDFRSDLWVSFARVERGNKECEISEQK